VVVSGQALFRVSGFIWSFSVTKTKVFFFFSSSFFSLLPFTLRLLIKKNTRKLRWQNVFLNVTPASAYSHRRALNGLVDMQNLGSIY
jgi:hypothetical protein